MDGKEYQENLKRNGVNNCITTIKTNKMEKDIFDKERYRYKVVDKSISGHCCFTHSVVDRNIIDDGSLNEVVCECFNKENAELICDMLNLKYLHI